MMIEVGQKVRFHPFDDIQSASKAEKHYKVTGTVVYVNAAKQWFSVEWGEPKVRTSFKFWYIGNGVELCGN